MALSNGQSDAGFPYNKVSDSSYLSDKSARCGALVPLFDIEVVGILLLGDEGACRSTLCQPISITEPITPANWRENQP
jgi:hypothetical protein